MANLYDCTERLKLLLYLNHRKSSVNTRHFDDNFQAVDDFARETDQKFVDQDTARNQMQSDLLEIIRTNKAAFDNHAADHTNPHAVTKSQVGLGTVSYTHLDVYKSQVVDKQVIPFNVGTLQNDSTHLDTNNSKEGVVRIISSTPYARRLY